MEIKVIEVFPTDEAKIKEIEMAKADWYIKMLLKRYPKDLLIKAFEALEEQVKSKQTN